MLKSKTVQIRALPQVRSVASDKWKKRPQMLRYWAFCNELRLRFGAVPEGVTQVSLTFALKVSESWSKKKKVEVTGNYHHQKPDLDNLVKAVLDALIPKDEGIAKIHAEKYWTDQEDQIEITLY